MALRQKPAQGTFLQIVVHVDAKGKHDYSAVLDGDVLRLTACDEDKMLWLIYQFLASGEDPRIEASDLPPAMIDIAHAGGLNSEGHTSEVQSSPKSSYAESSVKKKTTK